MDFKSFPCNQCGWCCQRTPCPLGLYLGEKPFSPCSHLKKIGHEKFECSLISDEKNPLKREAAKELILSGQGCTHKFGPSPLSLLKELLSRGLTPHMPEWKHALDETKKEYSKMNDPSVDEALAKFYEYAQQVESEQSL